MHGFKSFAKKEILKLSEGVTTVVGPNGCGKTNIVDAIRWVLGEQKSRVLRGGKMEDVIFNGAENMKPLSVCDVTLTVHNNKGRLPIEYNDIEIGRRVYRNGESEYTLNKTPCRLKDINDLFIDTGMGSDAYSVIELKMIEQILSENGDDRRRMFEEASGINKYRKQRKSTLRKFDATRFDLERISDVISEVEQKVHGLELQLKRFKRHEKLTEQLCEKDIQLAYLKIDRYQSLMLPLIEEIEEFKHLKSSKSDESSAHEKKLEKHRIIYKEQEQELNDLNSKMFGLTEQQQEIKQNILVWTEKGRSTVISIEKGKRDHLFNKNKIKLLKEQIIEYDKSSNNLQSSIDSSLATYKQEKDRLNKIESGYHKKLKKLDEIQNDRWMHQRSMANDRSIHNRTVELLEEKNNSYELLDKNILEQKQESQSLRKLIKKLEKSHKSLEKNLASKQIKVSKSKEALQNLLEKQNDLISHQNSLLVKKDSMNEQSEFYQELIMNNEGFPEGTQYVLENPKKFPGVLGTIADVFQVTEKYRDALETGLGDLSHCIISRDRDTALKTLDKAVTDKVGDITIIPLKEASNFKSKQRAVPKNKNVIAKASDIIDTDRNLKPLADYILGDLLIVNNINKAVNDESLNGWKLVDLNGSFSGNDLVLKSRQISQHGNLIGRKKKLEVISEEIKKIEKEEKSLIKKIEGIENNIESLNDDLNRQNKFVKEIEIKLNQVESELMKTHLTLSQVLENTSALKQNLIKTEKAITDLEKSLKKIKPGIEKAEKILEKFQDKVDSASENVSKSSDLRDLQQQVLQDARIEMINLESKRDNLIYKSTSAGEQVEELNILQNKILDEEMVLISSKNDFDRRIKMGEKELEKTNAEIQKQRSIIDLKQSVFSETYNTIDQIQTKIKIEQKDRESLLENLKISEFKHSELKQKIEIVKEQIKERYGSTIPKQLIIDETEEKLSYNIERIQMSLENIGPINMAVQDEYNEDTERLKHLQKQRDDLIKSEDNLRETIHKIDRIARKKFQETFKHINENYEKLFSLFFEGGQGHLRLVGDPDPLEADIVIEAQPPGKRNTSLRLLSSGEKALTAISLLFAIYQVKPSPYCILDEVDAPLDDVNIHKFTKVLKQFADETQFIIVTHNKLTMEIANHMYGVTQEKKGVSKLVSVSFD